MSKIKEFFSSKSRSGSTINLNQKARISFYFELGSEQQQIYCLSKENFYKSLKQLTNLNEEIIGAWIYNTPLHEKQPTLLLFHHTYIVLRTPSSWWSLEKNIRGICIQKNSKFEKVAYQAGMFMRYEKEKWKPKATKASTSLSLPMKYIIEYILDSGQLDNYDLLKNNCKGFTNRIYEGLQIGTKQYSKHKKQKQKTFFRKILSIKWK